MVICFGALVAITLSDNQTEEVGAEASGTNITRFLGIILIFANSWFTAGTFVINRALKGIDQGTIIFFHGFFGMITSLGYLLCDSLKSDDSLFFLRCTPKVYLFLLL